MQKWKWGSKNEGKAGQLLSVALLMVLWAGNWTRGAPVLPSIFNCSEILWNKHTYPNSPWIKAGDRWLPCMFQGAWMLWAPQFMTLMAPGSLSLLRNQLVWMGCKAMQCHMCILLAATRMNQYECLHKSRVCSQDILPQLELGISMLAAAVSFLFIRKGDGCW